MGHIIKDFGTIAGQAKVYKLAENFNPNSATTSTFDCTSIPNYENLTVTNFYLVITATGSWGTTKYDSSNAQGNYGGKAYNASLSYNSSTGILTVTNLYSRCGGNRGGWTNVFPIYSLTCIP